MENPIPELPELPEDYLEQVYNMDLEQETVGGAENWSEYYSKLDDFEGQMDHDHSMDY